MITTRLHTALLGAVATGGSAGATVTLRLGRRRTLCTAVFVSAVSACASGQGGSSGAIAELARGAVGGRPPAVFVLSSQYPGPVSLYATNGASRVRLATLSAWRTIHVMVPAEMVGRGRTIRLVARPIGERRQVTTDLFAVERGDRVFWTLTQPIDDSLATLHIAVAPDR